MTIYLSDDAFSVKAKRFNKMFTSILTLFFLLRIANKSHFYASMLLKLLHPSTGGVWLKVLTKDTTSSLTDSFS